MRAFDPGRVKQPYRIDRAIQPRATPHESSARQSSVGSAPQAQLVPQRAAPSPAHQAQVRRAATEPDLAPGDSAVPHQLAGRRSDGLEASRGSRLRIEVRAARGPSDSSTLESRPTAVSIQHRLLRGVRLSEPPIWAAVFYAHQRRFWRRSPSNMRPSTTGSVSVANPGAYSMTNPRAARLRLPPPTPNSTLSKSLARIRCP